MPNPPRLQPDELRLLTRLGELEVRIGELEAELGEAQRLATLGVFAGAVAHEVNNILTPVVAYIQRAQSSQDDKALTDKALQISASAAERASRIAAAILGFLADDGPDTVNVGHALRDALACMGREPAKDGVELSVSIPPACFAAIRPVALQQVFMNLISNSVRAMRSARARNATDGDESRPASDGDTALATKRVRPQRTAPTRTTDRLIVVAERSTWNRLGREPVAAIRITIQDTGPGMPRAMAERIFEPMVHRHGAGAERPGGTTVADAATPSTRGAGLGLAICARLIRAAGGEIELRTGHTGDGGGARFTITLPAL